MNNMDIIVDNQFGFLDANPVAKALYPELSKLEKSEIVPSEVIKLFEENDFCVNKNEKHFGKEVEAITQKNRVIGYSMLLIDNTEHHKLMELRSGKNLNM